MKLFSFTVRGNSIKNKDEENHCLLGKDRSSTLAPLVAVCLITVVVTEDGASCLFRPEPAGLSLAFVYVNQGHQVDVRNSMYVENLRRYLFFGQLK